MTREEADKLQNLLSLHSDGRLGDEKWVELVSMLWSSEESRKTYVQYMFMQAALHRVAGSAAPPAAARCEAAPLILSEDIDCLEQPGGTAGGAMPVLLGNAFNRGVEFFSRSLVFSFIFAIILPSAMCLCLAFYVALQGAKEPAPVVWAPPAPSLPVAEVTGTHHSIWSDADAGVASGTRLVPGRKLSLLKGLAQITFDGGARLLLEGPAMFEAVAADQGYLHVGSAVAQVPKGAEGFSVRTPAITVVDYGTEFGACVEDERGTAELHVFQGEVGLSVGGAEGKDKTLSLLQAGRMVRIEPVAFQSEPLIRDIKPVASRFARSLPAAPVEPVKPPAPPEPDPFQDVEQAVVDNFDRDKVEEAQRPGWSNSWNVAGRNFGARFYAMIAQDNPLGKGGKYLRYSVQRQSSKLFVENTIYRRFREMHDFNPALPYTITFDLRIDELGNFNRVKDYMAVCGDRDAVLNATEWTGWKVFAVGSDAQGGKPGNWKFLAGSKKIPLPDIDSGVPVREGAVYSFCIEIDPHAGTWTPAIGMNGVAPKNFAAMKLCSVEGGELCGYWSMLNFQWSMEEGENESNEGEFGGFSLDSVRIIQTDKYQTAHRQQ